MSIDPNDIIPVADLATVTAGEYDHIVLVQNGRARKAVAPEVTAAAGALGNVLSGMEANASASVQLIAATTQASANAMLAQTEADTAVILAGIGYLPPVAFAAGILVDSTRVTVAQGGTVYAPAANVSLPFTTTQTFNPSQWRVVQGVTGVDLSSAAGANMVGLPQGGTVGDAIRHVSATAYGAKPNGTAFDDAPAFLAALAATPDGGELLIAPGRYNVRTPISISGKGITVTAKGVTLVQAANVNVLTINGAWSQVLPVVSTADILYTDGDSSGVPGMDIVLSAPPPADWRSGDLVKLFSDDVIPGSRPQVGTAKPRLGEFFFIASISGSVVRVGGRTFDQMATNRRLAKLHKTPVNLSGLRIESANAESYTGYGVMLNSVYGGDIDNITFGSMPQVCLTTRSCYGVVGSITCDRSNNDPEASQAGYGWHDAASESCQIDVIAAHVRHAYTDDNNPIEAADPNPWRYGRSARHTINVIARETSSTAVGTHSTSRGLTFPTITATNCRRCIGLRGIGHNIGDLISDGCQRGPFIFDEDRLGESSDSLAHHIGKVVVRNMRTTSADDAAIFVNANTAASPRQGVRETAAIHIGEVLLDGFNRGVISVTNHSVRVGRITAIAPETLPNNLGMVLTTNAELIVDDLDLDFRRLVSGTDFTVFRDSLSPSHVEFKKAYLRIKDSDAIKFAGIAQGLPETMWRIDFRSDYQLPRGNLLTEGREGSKFDWLDLATGRNRAWHYITANGIDSAAVPLIVSSSMADTFFIRANPTNAAGDKTLAKFLPGSFLGQRLNITNMGQSGRTVTVGHGSASYLTINMDVQDVVLADGETAEWVWDGTNWVQHVGVNRRNVVRAVRTITTSNSGLSSRTDALVFLAGGSAVLPSAFGNVRMYTFRNTSGASRGIATVSSQTINGASSPYSLPAGSSVTLVSDGSNWFSV